MIKIYKNYIIFINNKNQFHRENGPAIINSNGDKSWYQNGKYHRENGPAVIHADGTKF